MIGKGKILKALNKDGKIVEVVGFLGSDYGNAFRCVAVTEEGKFIGYQSFDLTVIKELPPVESKPKK